MNSFNELGEPLRSLLPRLGYTRPTPIQERTIPLIIRGYNVFIVAPTGSGKTEAALFPIFSKLAGTRSGGIKAIYVTPLRSLNRDIFKRMKDVASSIGLRLDVRHGDTSTSAKRRFLHRPPHIMVTTPETLYFLLSVEKFRESLRELRFLIIDEAHEVFSSKRGAELSLALERIDALYTRKRLQVIGLSATVRRPIFFAKRLFSWRHFILVEDNRRRRIVSIVDTRDKQEDIYRAIAEYVDKSNKVLVFTNTRDTAEIVGAVLRQALGEDLVKVHHGSLSKDVRLDVEKDFREGRVKAVVATSSLELGIDIGDVDLVIQYMSPRQVVKYVQRVGRSGHREGLVSRGIIVSLPNIFDILESAVIAQRAKRGNLEEPPFYRKAVDALIHQIAGVVIERGSIRLEELHNLVTRSHFYSDMTLDELVAIISLMEQSGLVKLKDSSIRPGYRLARYYFGTTMIPDVKHYPVIDIETGKRIGLLDEEFVATLERGEVFVLSGNTWETVDIGDEVVRVRRSKSQRLLPPSWEGDLIPVEEGVAREVGSLLRRAKQQGFHVLSEYPLSEHAYSYVRTVLLKAMKELEQLPSDKTVLVEHYRDTIVFYTFLGSRGNMALEYLLARLVEEMTGYPPETTSTPYIVALRLNSGAASGIMKGIISALNNLDTSDIENLIEASIKRSRVYRWVLLHVALRAGAVSKQASLSEVKRLLPALIDTVLGEEAMHEMKVKKLDIRAVVDFIEQLRSGRRKLYIRSKEGFSALTLEAIGESRFPERLRATTLPSSILSEVVKRRLSSKQVRLVCMQCGHTFTRSIGSLEQNPRCPHCGSGLLAPAYNEDEARSMALLVKRLRRRERLTRDEKKALREYMERANLVIEYGKKAIEALSYHGVGVATAKHVLRKLVFGEESFYKALVEAETRYHRYKHRLRH